VTNALAYCSVLLKSFIAEAPETAFYLFVVRPLSGKFNKTFLGSKLECFALTKSYDEGGAHSGGLPFRLALSLTLKH
jgi:hypothetical protein